MVEDYFKTQNGTLIKKCDKIFSDSSVSINILIRTYLICLSAIYLRHSYLGSFSVCVSVNVICKENNGLVEDGWIIPQSTSQCSTVSFSQLWRRTGKEQSTNPYQNSSLTLS